MGLELGRFRRAFVFSLDAYTALALVLITIYSLFIMVNLPKGYYSTLDQAYDIAKDSLAVLDNTPYPLTGETNLERIHSIYVGTPGCSPTCATDVTRDVLGKSIPRQWGYVVEYSNQAGVWSTIYDTRSDGDAGNLHKDVKLRKVAASAKTIISNYATSPAPGASQYCYITGQGYQGPGLPNSCASTPTPCNEPKSNFYPGSIDVGIIRITVFT